MKIVLLGVSGAGKGTQAKRLAKYYEIEHISTGDILREHISYMTDLGREIQHVIDSGKLVSDDIIIGIVKQRIAEARRQQGYILDGFPRNINQAKSLAGFAKIDRAVYVKVEDKAVIERLTGRQVCPICGQMYHLVNIPPKTAGFCDHCGAALVQREDDKAETVIERLRIFHELTEPIIEFYKEKGLLLEVDGEGAIDQITNSILDGLGRL